MASSGSKSVSVTSWNTLKFSWEITSQSVANNTSTVAWKMQLIAGSSGRINSSASKDWSVTVNGTTYSGTNKVGISSGETITLASGTTTIKHNSDGTKTFSYSFSQEFAITFSSAWVGTKSGSGSGTLDTIHQKSTLAASNGTLGTAQTLTVTRQSTSLTHTITYKCGSASGTVCTKSSSTSISFTPPISLASQNTTGTTVSVVFTITTYSGSTSVGSNTKTITCSIPASVKPTVTVAVSDPTGYSDTFGGYLQSMSKFRVVVTASGAYGSTIKAYSTTADGNTYTAALFTTDVIGGSGSLKINVTVTDSRGRTATTSVTANVIAYSKPKITTLSVKRCDETGVSVSNGNYLAVSFDAAISSINLKNTATYKLQYKKTTDANYTEVALDNYVGYHTVVDGLYIFEAATDSSYDVVLIVTDTLISTKRGTTGASVSKLFSLLRRGLGFAFGKVAELEGVLDIAFKTRFLGGIMPVELAPGTDLNEVTKTGWYIGNASGGNFLNCPLTSGTFTLEVMSAGAAGQLYQNLDYCSKTDYKAFRRFFYQTEWGEWIDPHSTVPVDVQAEIAELRTKVNNVIPSVYPVGSIYVSVNSTSPATLFGGTWERIQNKFLLASGSIYSEGSSGGSAYYNLYATHKHVAPIGHSASAVGAININGTTDEIGVGKDYRTAKHDYTGTLTENVTTYYTSDGIVSAQIPTMPPYLAVYVWKRTA